MRTRLRLLFACMTLLAPLQASAGTVYVATVSDVIGPAIADYLHKAIEQSAREGAVALIIELDTPGGEVIPVYSVLTAALPPLVSVQATAHLSTAELRALDISRRTQGYHLVSSAGVGEDYTAVWIRALPYLRFQGTPCTSTQCQSLALPFAQLVPPLLQLTPGKVGQFTRPSGTIAVLLIRSAP